MRKAYSYIRMSSEKQLHGDSLRRQLELSEKYALENGLEIVDNIDGKPFKDIGISGFKGQNSVTGVLSTFIQFLQDGKIEENSVLLVESLDRLSRDNVSNALSQFLNIINSGVEIVTLTDNQKYTKSILDNNVGSLFVSLGVMFRANEESEIKSKRLSAAWVNKRALAGVKPLTKIAPAWLKYDETVNKFIEIEERSDVVRKIFDLCANSCGLWSITRYLNENNIPVFGKAEYWNRSYVKKIISNRAVLGELQAHSMVNGKRQPIGDPILNYYPKLLSDDVFHLAAAAIENRKVKGAGRKGSTFSNVFSGLLYCHQCGSTIAVRNRGAAPKGGKTLVCNNKLQGAGCTSPDWKLSLYEKLIFKHLHEVNFDELIHKENNEPDQEKQLLALKQELSAIESKINQFIDLASEDQLSVGTKTRFIERITKFENEADLVKGKISLIEKAIQVTKSQFQAFNNVTLKAILKLIDEKSDDYFFRSSLNSLLTRIIQRVDLIEEPHLYQPWEIEHDDHVLLAFYSLKPKIKALSHSTVIEREDFIEFWKQQQRRIKVTYKTGDIRHIFVSEGFSLLV